MAIDEQHFLWRRAHALELGRREWRRVAAVGRGYCNDACLYPTEVHYVRSYSAAGLLTFHCERVCKMSLSRLENTYRYVPLHRL